MSRYLTKTSAARCLSLALGVALMGPAGGAAAADDFVSSIERAHGAEAWRRRTALRADLTVDFGGGRAIDGTMLVEIHGFRTRFELKDGTRLVWDGREAWVAPAESPFKGARFHVLTWPYFLSIPMKLRDPGTKIAGLGPLPLMGRSMPAAKLTFDGGVGDTPDDWYLLYRDPDTSRLRAMGYIVTFGKTREQAGKETHGISYDEFVTIEGVAVPVRWSFWSWTREGGFTGEPIGRAELTHVSFVTPGPGAFDKPDGARADPIPVKVSSALFSMYCYWTGEATVGRIPGVVRTRIGDLDGAEVVQVEFDPARTSVRELIAALKAQGSFYAHIEEPHGEVRFTEPKHSLRTVHPELHALGLTEAQAIALNTWSYFGGSMPDVLTPEQKERLGKAKLSRP